MITTGSSIIIGATLISLSIFYSKKDVFRKVQIWNWKFISTILIFFLIISAIDDNWSFFTISLIALLVTIIRIVALLAINAKPARHQIQKPSLWMI